MHLVRNNSSMQPTQLWSVGKSTFIMIMIFYCGLVVHITDTRAQKVVSYTSAHIAETVFAHDQHWEEQSCLSSPQLYRHSQKHRKWINHTVGHYTTGVSTCPALRGARHFPSTSYFLSLVCTQCPHILHDVYL